ncbi:MAG: hypothetical protein H6620_02280 [Halobacteriovoraceae bacterium]|nr:hypothetical protein [Halobacteriovoraceae bacterium]
MRFLLTYMGVLLLLSSCISSSEEELSTIDGSSISDPNNTSNFTNPPELIPISNITVTEGVLENFTGLVSLADLSYSEKVFYDCRYDVSVDGEVTSPLSCDQIPGFTFDYQTGDFTWQVPYNAFINGDYGVYELKIISISVLGSSEMVFNIIVNDMNTSAILAHNIPFSSPNIYIPIGTSIETYLSGPADFYDSMTNEDFDLDDEDLTYSCTFDRTETVNWLLVDSNIPCGNYDFDIDANTGELTGIPKKPGSYIVYIMADDGVSTVSDNITMIVDDPLSPIGQGYGSDWNYVPGNSGLGTEDFYVMRYEAKNMTYAFSGLSGAPWTNISANAAFDECKNLGTGYAMITNSEWMTVARNLEKVDNNWTGGSIGSGCLKRGNNGEIVSTCGGYNGADPEYGSGRNTNAKLFLSTGMEIWDFSGNVGEFVDWADQDQGNVVYISGPTSCSATFVELNAVSCGGVVDNDYNSVFGYTSTEGMGRFYGGLGGAAYRGGYSSGLQNTGLYTIVLSLFSTSSTTSVGFRCVYRPPVL